MNLGKIVKKKEVLIPNNLETRRGTYNAVILGIASELQATQSQLNVAGRQGSPLQS